jgi:DNA-binding transcriptional LysR family regulator
MSDAISLDLYDVFVAIAEARSVTAAAKRLRTTKATVSRSLARLEEQVGTELVHRSTRSLSLSAAGNTLYEMVAPGVTALRDASLGISAKKAVPRGTLRVTAPVDLGAFLLPDVFATCAARYPEIVMEARLTNDVLDLVGEGLDVALRVSTTAPRDSGLTSRKLGTIVMGVYAAPAYLARHGTPKRIGDDGHEWLIHTSARRALARSTRPRLVSNDMVLLRDLAKRAVGVGVLPQFVASSLVVTGELTRIIPGESTVSGSVSLVYPSSGQVARKVEVFRDIVIETLRARPLPS